MVDCLAYLKHSVAANRQLGKHTAIIMTDVSTAFPSTTRGRVLRTPRKHNVHPTVTSWVNNWLSDRTIETWLDDELTTRSLIECGVPQGSPCSPILFALTLAEALKSLPTAVSYVDDCSWAIPFESALDFQTQATRLLDASAKYPRFRK